MDIRRRRVSFAYTNYTALMALDYTNLPYWDLYAALRLARLAGPDLAEWVAFFRRSAGPISPSKRCENTYENLRQPGA